MKLKEESDNGIISYENGEIKIVNKEIQGVNMMYIKLVFMIMGALLGLMMNYVILQIHN